MSKSKRIKDAAKELERALKKHVDVVTDSAVSMKKAQRAAARLASAAQVYAEAVSAKTGLDNPFLTGGGKLDEEATRSLLAERDGIAKSLTGSLPALPELPTEIDLSPAELHALESSAEPADGTALDDAVEDWEDDATEVDEDEDLPEDETPDDDEASEAPIVAAEPVEQWVGDSAPATDDLGGAELFANILAVTSDSPEPTGDAIEAAGETATSEPAEAAGEAAPEAPGPESPTPAETPAAEQPAYQPPAYGAWPTPVSGDVPVATPTTEPWASASPTPSAEAAAESEQPASQPRHASPEPADEPSGTADDGTQPPALPEQEPASEEEKPYSEDI